MSIRFISLRHNKLLFQLCVQRRVRKLRILNLTRSQYSQVIFQVFYAHLHRCTLRLKRLERSRNVCEVENKLPQVQIEAT